MIVRLMGEGQYELANDLQAQLNAIDEQAGAAAESGDEAELHQRLGELAGLVRSRGQRLADEDIRASDLIVPPSDLSLDEARQLFKDGGLIPDLPV
jgi:PspA-Associated protein